MPNQWQNPGMVQPPNPGAGISFPALAPELPPHMMQPGQINPVPNQGMPPVANNEWLPANEMAHPSQSFIPN